MTPNKHWQESKGHCSSLVQLVEELAALMPEQAPLHAFVHHNTLHAFEHLPFFEAVEQASQVLGGEPYLAEIEYARSLESGRISRQDIQTVLEKQSSPEDHEELFDCGPSRFQLQLTRLFNYLPHKGQQVVAWERDEGLLFKSFLPRSVFVNQGLAPALELPRIWESLELQSKTQSSGINTGRIRDLLASLQVGDPDCLVHPLMIRFSAAYLDQGMSYWHLPLEQHDYYNAFLKLYSQRGFLSAPWQTGLARELQELLEHNISAEACIQRVLERQGVSNSDYRQFLQSTLLSLRGWAGMIHQAEVRPDRMIFNRPPARLLDYLAIQLLLDNYANRFLCQRAFGQEHSYTELRKRYLQKYVLTQDSERIDLELCYEAFCVAQLLGLKPAVLESPRARQIFLHEIALFNGFKRRRLLHLAYEFHHRAEIFDGLLNHRKLGLPIKPRAGFQAVFCIDDREESLRRHLEELRPACQTFGYAGFFGVAMSFQGVDDVHAKPLCPVVVTPQHFVREVPCEESFYSRYQSTRRLLAGQAYSAFIGSKTLVRGAFFSQVLGLFSFLPLVLRCLSPRLYSKLVKRLGHTVLKSPKTIFLLERPEGEGKQADGLYHGFTSSEMTQIVNRMLTTIGLTKDFSRLVLVVGHGSSSLNNPHNSAYNCGAAGGGKGGSNARAFALMANHPEVRRKLAELGIEIPQTTWFVGAYHNTCDDSMTYYDQDFIPAELSEFFQATQKDLLQACMLDAHERCRRFEAAPPKLTAQRALKHVEQHANDLAQPRPEYNHATNAVCLVARRQTSRGLFLDRRAFLVSYDPTCDISGQTLENLLLAVGPVGAGINLEYYFSTVDPLNYGCGTKLPHNVTGLLGVMDGHASDLRTGLAWQMVEIHEPVRLLVIVERDTATLESIVERNAGLAQLVKNGWIQFAALSPETGQIQIFENGNFVPYQQRNFNLASVHCSQEHYSNHMEHLPCAHIENAESEV